jgi:EAL domain-containing protein (putative c-di-GMP-specific phosphodiesterase class I)
VLDAHDINQIASSESQDLGLRIMKALTEERFRLYGQQIVSLGPPGMAGAHCEMLIHLVDEHGRDIPPGVFIPAAEREGMMRTLDRWVVRSVFRKLRDQPDPDVAVWVVNLSIPTLIDEGFPGFVNALQAEFQVSPRAICFEFDETVALANLGHVIRVIEALRPQGYAFCLSHFGVGMSTFSYLRTIQVDYVKIDGTLIRDVAVDTVDRAIVSGICHIAHVMGIRTIAGMVEDERLIDQLRALGLDYVQGFAVAEPEPITV